MSALSEKECELWVKGLRHLVQDTINAPYPLQVERWLRKEFYAMENSRETQVLFLTIYFLHMYVRARARARYIYRLYMAAFFISIIIDYIVFIAYSAD